MFNFFSKKEKYLNNIFFTKIQKKIKMIYLKNK